MGVAQRLREHNERVKIIGVQPSKLNHQQEGLLNPEEYCPEILDKNELDQIIAVEDKDATLYARNLLKKEGLFVGVSSGSAMYGAVRTARALSEGFIVVLFADHGYKYLSTGCFR